MPPLPRIAAHLLVLCVFALLAPSATAVAASFAVSSPPAGSSRLASANDPTRRISEAGVTPLFQDDGNGEWATDETGAATSTWEPTWEPTAEPTWVDPNPTWEPPASEDTGYVEPTPEWETISTEPTAESGDDQTWEEPIPTEGTSYDAQPVAADPDWRNTHWALGPGQIQGTWKEVVVSISDQYMWAYEGGELVTSTLVSTGTAEIPETVTPIGYHTVVAKFDKQTMEGTISGEYYRVEDVPFVMYFDDLGNALHGTYWHNNFGTPMSHGCVNLPMDIAAVLYEWAPVGTAVTVIS